MQMIRIDGLSFAMDGDCIDLEQDYGLGEVDRVRLHRIHLAHLAELAGVLSADDAADRSIRTLQRRLLTLAREIRSFAEWVRSGADDDAGTFPDFLQVTALDTLAQALVDDLPGATPLDIDPAIKLIEARNQLDCQGGAVPKTGPLFPRADGAAPSRIGTSPESGLAARQPVESAQINLGGDVLRANPRQNADSSSIQSNSIITPHKPTTASAHSEAHYSLFEDQPHA